MPRPFFCEFCVSKPPPWLRPRCYSDASRRAPAGRARALAVCWSPTGPFPAFWLGRGDRAAGPRARPRARSAVRREEVARQRRAENKKRSGRRPASATARPQRRQARGYRERGCACVKQNLNARSLVPTFSAGPPTPRATTLPRHPRAGGDPVSVAPEGLDPRLRGGDEILGSRECRHAKIIHPSASFTKSAHLSPIMMLGALVLPLTSLGITLASAIHNPSIPRNFSFGSTTLSASDPMRQVPTGW